MTIKIWMPELAMLMAVLGLASVGCTPPKNDFVAPPPPQVTVASPVAAPVKMILERTGNTEAVEEAVVSSRVRGFIEHIPFKPGDEVKAGELLYKIEKNQYQAKKDSAVAAVAAATAAIAVAKGNVETVEAEVSRSKRDFDRQALLQQQMATSEAEYETAQAAMEAAEANLVSAKAQVEAAEAAKQEAEAALVQATQDLDYTEVKAPIAGRISKTDVKLGNLIEDGQDLATIVNRDQVFANFTISDREALRLQKMEVGFDPEHKAGLERWYNIQVYLRRETEDEFRFQGHINYVDQQGIDPETGTLGVRAIFDNPDDLLIPGLFVHLRIPYGDEKSSLLIPEAALSRNNQGPFVFLVGNDNEVEQRSVTTGAKLDGWVVIEQGLSGDDLVVIEGLQRARPGAKVVPQRTTLKVEGSRFIGAPQSEAETGGGASSGGGAGQPKANQSNEDAAKKAPGDSSKS